MEKFFLNYQVSNSYFQFKQFRIAQDRCAMKVSTDACIQGAWTPVDNEVKEILDIGAGTGLLALMLAQRAPGDHIDAIELDVDAAQQAAENVAASPWAASVQVIQGDVTQYLFNKKYELIICNPPFFNNSLLSDSDSKNMARHTGALNYEQLFSAIENNMAAKSVASVMLPVPEHELWEALLNKHGWSVQKKLLVQSKQ